MKSWSNVSVRSAVLCCAASAILACNAQAALYLTGFELYRCTADGTAISDSGGGFYFYSSNPSYACARQFVTPPSGPVGYSSISFALAPGNNVFTFSPDVSADPGSYGGVELFFNDTGASYNPNAAGILPDLAAFVPVSSLAAPTAPAGGISVIDYGASYGAHVAYGGAGSFVLDGSQIAVTSLSMNHSPSGSMTLTVSAVPEPASISLLVIAGILMLRRRPGS